MAVKRMSAWAGVNLILGLLRSPESSASAKLPLAAETVVSFMEVKRMFISSGLFAMDRPSASAKFLRAAGSVVSIMAVKRISACAGVGLMSVLLRSP
jgi:hypothetical protein